MHAYMQFPSSLICLVGCYSCLSCCTLLLTNSPRTISLYCTMRIKGHERRRSTWIMGLQDYNNSIWCLQFFSLKAETTMCRCVPGLTPFQPRLALDFDARLLSIMKQGGFQNKGRGKIIVHYTVHISLKKRALLLRQAGKQCTHFPLIVDKNWIGKQRERADIDNKTQKNLVLTPKS